MSKLYTLYKYIKRLASIFSLRKVIFSLANTIWRKPLKLPFKKIEYLSELDMRDIGGKEVMLLSPLVYAVDGVKEKVPAGFISDLASVPQRLQWLFSNYTSFMKGVVVHDADYENRAKEDKALADYKLYYAAKAAGHREGEARLVYYSIRYGGWHAWLTD